MSIRAVAAPPVTPGVTPESVPATQPQPAPQPAKELTFFEKVGMEITEVASRFDFIHVPMFNLYFKCKQNVFFNTEDAQAKHFEAAGNFLLTPVRYLLTGKTIQQIDAGKVEKMDLSFSYAEDSGSTEMVKTVLAILTLPISLILGSVLKGIAYISPSIREKHQIIGRELHSTAVVDNTEIYRRSGINELFSNELLPHENYPAPPPTAKQVTLTNAVRDVAAVLGENNIPHWMDCGTLLGARRHGRIIPWDTDVDMGILAVDFTNTLNALRRLDPEKYEAQDWSCCRRPNMLIRVLIKEQNCYLDLYNHVLNPQDQTFIYQYSWTGSPWVPHVVERRETVQERPMPITTLFPLKKARFGDATVNVPGNWEDFLKVKYGPNLDPCKVWNETTNQFERVPDHPYWLQSDI